jgi:hypothetical protein
MPYDRKIFANYWYSKYQFSITQNHQTMKRFSYLDFKKLQWFFCWFLSFTPITVIYAIQTPGEVVSTIHKEIASDTINIPQVVRPEVSGVLRLTAEVGRAIGPEIKYMPEWKAFGWFTAKDHVEWEVSIPKEGTYEVYLEWSVSDKEAGKPFIFEAGDASVKGKVKKSGSWETFQIEKIGRIQLREGIHKLLFKPASDFPKGGALLDLREIKLIPVL